MLKLVFFLYEIHIVGLKGKKYSILYYRVFIFTNTLLYK